MSTLFEVWDGAIVFEAVVVLNWAYVGERARMSLIHIKSVFHLRYLAFVIEIAVLAVVVISAHVVQWWLWNHLYCWCSTSSMLQAGLLQNVLVILNFLLQILLYWFHSILFLHICDRTRLLLRRIWHIVEVILWSQVWLLIAMPRYATLILVPRLLQILIAFGRALRFARLSVEVLRSIEFVMFAIVLVIDGLVGPIIIRGLS